MLIGITGRLKCGKDTLATYIQEALPAEELVATTRTSFAKPLRDVCEAAFGSRYEKQEEKAALDQFWAFRVAGAASRERSKPADEQVRAHLGDEPTTGRRILQFIGTEMFRDLVHPDFWVLCLARRWEAHKIDGGQRHLIVTDCRFDNEAAFFRDNGGIVLRLRRGGVPEEPITHASEKGVSDDLISADLTCNSLEELRGLAHLIATSMTEDRVQPYLTIIQSAFGTNLRGIDKGGCTEVRRQPQHHTIGGEVSMFGTAVQGKPAAPKDDTVCADFDGNPDGPQG